METSRTLRTPSRGVETGDNEFDGARRALERVRAGISFSGRLAGLCFLLVAVVMITREWGNMWAMGDGFREIALLALAGTFLGRAGGAAEEEGAGRGEGGEEDSGDLRAELERTRRELREAMARVDRLEREAVTIAAREHKRIGEYLHDNIGQLLTGIGFLSQGLEQRLRERGAPEVETAVEIRTLTVQVISETRHLSRGFFAVNLESHGLGYALAELADFVKRTYGVECRFSEPESLPSFSLTIAMHLYRIAQEAINNAIKHGDASEIVLSLSAGDGTGGLSVWNNGCEFSPPDGADGIGLRIMNRRAAEIGGSISIASEERGVRLVCNFPFSEESL